MKKIAMESSEYYQQELIGYELKTPEQVSQELVLNRLLKELGCDLDDVIIFRK